MTTAAHQPLSLPLTARTGGRIPETGAWTGSATPSTPSRAATNAPRPSTSLGPPSRQNAAIAKKPRRVALKKPENETARVAREMDFSEPAGESDGEQQVPRGPKYQKNGGTGQHSVAPELSGDMARPSHRDGDDPHSSQVQHHPELKHEDENGKKEDPDDDRTAYCVCRERFDGRPMVQCDRCSEWFHFSCLKVSADTIDLDAAFFCPCRASSF